MRKNWLFRAVGVLAACLVIYAVLTMLPHRGLSEANIDRIREGMTLEEVEGILGRPRDMDWGNDAVAWFGPKDDKGRPNAYVIVDFDEERRVVGKTSRIQPSTSWFQRTARRWLLRGERGKADEQKAPEPDGK